MGHVESSCKREGLAQILYYYPPAPTPHPAEAAGRVTLLSQSAPTAHLCYEGFLTVFMSRHFD